MRARPGLSIAAVLFAAAICEAAPFAVEITAGELNVRSSAMGTILGQVRSGNRFVAHQSSGGWVQIDWRGQKAWISGDYARRIPADSVRVAVDALNVRTGGSTSNSVLGVVYQNQMFVKLGAVGNWARIQFDRREAWVAGWLVSDVSLRNGAPASGGTTTQPPASGAGQPMSATASELEVMARIIKGEAGVCSYEGKVAVGAVILNRVRHRQWPDNIIGVCHQPWQFSCYNANVRNQLYWGAIPSECFQAARDALNGNDPSRSAEYYFNPYLVMPSWANSLIFTRRIGTNSVNTHDFYSARTN